MTNSLYYCQLHCIILLFYSQLSQVQSMTQFQYEQRLFESNVQMYPGAFLSTDDLSGSSKSLLSNPIKYFLILLIV